MSKTIFTLFILLASLHLYAQQDNGNGVPSSYERNSLTVFYIDNAGERHWSKAKEKVAELMFSDKYDNHNLGNLFFKPGPNLEAESSTPITDAFRMQLIRNNVARNVIAKWYNRTSDGTMDMELVHQRGRFTATDADYLVASSTRRGDAALQDLGNRLINRSYVLLIDVQNITSMQEADNKDLKGWRADVKGYLYKVDFNDEVREAFYNTWIYEDDSPEVKEQKRQAFEALNIPMTYITNVAFRINCTQTRKFGTKSEDELLGDMVQKAHDEMLYNLEMKVEDFKVTTPLFARRPLRAKIGLKEGVKTDYRFFVYEHVYNQRTNSVKPVRRGVIRASSGSKIHDNRHEAFGETGTSQFYQVAGRRLHEGYTLVQKNDFGIEVTLGGEIGEIGGGYGRLDIRTGRFTGIRALFVYVEAGLDGGDYGYTEDFSFLRFGAGLAKGLQISRNIELRPYAGVGVESASSETFSDDDTLEAYYLKIGANLSLNLSHNFQLIGGAGSYSFITDAESESGYNFGSWSGSDAFEGRTGLSVLAGIKFMF